jgi:hypothetical protein
MSPRRVLPGAVPAGVLSNRRTPFERGQSRAQTSVLFFRQRFLPAAWIKA